MLFIIREALIDSLELIPFLLVIYAGIAWLEYRYEEIIQARIRRAGNAGPLLGALFGCLPQCGFSVVGSALYARGLITTGTLLAVFISTSDEAVPIIMAHPARITLVIPLLCTKVVLALLAGYLVDAVAKRSRKIAHGDLIPLIIANHETMYQVQVDDHQTSAEAHRDESSVEVDGCCGHHLTGNNKIRTLLVHPLLHTAQVFLVLFAITIGLNILIGKGGAHLGTLLGQGTIWQPVIAAFIGLIPNCGASVAIITVYLKGGMSFGALIAGLSPGVGLGMLVLVKENRNRWDTLRILTLLLGFSIAAGILIQCFLPDGLLPR